MEERKSMGGALVDVFDAGVTLVKAEINTVGRKVGEVAKAKGVGVVMLLGAVGPLIMGLIFLILTLFYGLMALGLPAWASALLIALLSLGLTVALVLLGIKKLGAEVDTHEPLMHRDDGFEDAGDRAGGMGSAAPAGTTSGVAASGVTVGSATYAATATRKAETMTYVATPGADLADAAGTTTHTVSAVEAHSHGAHGHDDPDIQRPVVLRDAPGIRVSTEPTYREDMKKEGY